VLCLKTILLVIWVLQVDITEVRIKLVNDPEDRLRAFCSITLDGEFVVRDLKIIQGQRGNFVEGSFLFDMRGSSECTGSGGAVVATEIVC
jgi:hypothetical protein